MYIIMKKIFYYTIGVLILTLVSCENFLDTESFTQKDTGSFPKSETDVEQMLAGVYNNLQAGVYDGTVRGGFFMASELACDDRLGGAGSNDIEIQALDFMMQSSLDQYSSIWSTRYAGISRANSIIENIDNCEIPAAKKAKMLGESYCLRAYYYYELASMFENIPLHLTTKPEPLAQASPDETWGQIIADLKTAIELMPAQKTPASESGHVDKYVAEAIMGRAFLFYTGFYGKTEVALPDGGTVTKQDVIAWIDDCVNNSGYTLVPDYRNLWAYTNRFAVEHYPYTQGQGLHWVEDDNGLNPESMLAIKLYVNAGYLCNRYFVFCGMRNTSGLAAEAFPFGNGWGAGPVATNLWTDWPDTDLRKRASICAMDVETPLVPLGGDGLMQETRYFFKKGSIRGFDGSEYADTFEKLMYNLTSQWDYTIVHDQVLIRFAEVLLMQSELKEDATGMNLVRNRAGLGPIAYSLANIQNERRFEMAFEGVRWNDMRRWGATYAKTALAKQGDLPIYNKGVADVNRTASFYTQRYDATRGFFSIPNAEIILSDGLYHQNEGWDNSSIYTGW